MHEKPRLNVALVTPTRDRAPLLRRLKASLDSQTDMAFTWVIYDDASTDKTRDMLQEWRENPQAAAYGLEVFTASSAGGKGRALNRVFDRVLADLYVIVDSDDYLLPTAMTDIKASAHRYLTDEQVGALFFEYRDPTGRSLRGRPSQDDVVATRVNNDRREGKYDGCVAYFSRVTHRYRYPEFPDEFYVGPTVLQLLMSPKFSIAFIPTVVGVAEYQQGGLTAQGRSLRTRNPRGMRIYSALQLQQSEGRKERVTTALKFAAYDHLSQQEASTPLENEILPGARGSLRWFEKAAGAALATSWRTRHLDSTKRQ